MINRGTVLYKIIGRVLLCGVAVSTWMLASLAFAEGTQPAKVVASVALGGNTSGGGSSGSDTALPDLFTGALSYQIPIEVPLGRNGMDPGLALSYNSRNGNGWVGMGWDLEVGAIERSTRTGVDYGSNNYVLRRAGSASELVAVTPSEYRAKIESDFTKISQVKVTDSSISRYFIATNKAGIKFYFGQSENSCVYGSQGVFKWALNRIEDLNGNSITFTYSRDNGQIYLEQIDYNGNQIKFYPEDRSDAPDSYISNFLIKTAKRLKTIDVFGADGNRVRSYDLVYRPNYSQATGRSLLSKLILHGKDDVQVLTTMDFGWLDNPGRWSGEVDSTIFANGTNQNGYGEFDNDNWQTIRLADVNGDGKTDLCIRHDSGLQCYLGTENGFVYSKEYDSFATGQFIFSNSTDQHGYGTFDNDNWGTLQFVDVNGDGKADVCMRNDSGVQCYLSTGNGWVYSAGYDSFATGQLIFSNSTNQHGYGTFDNDNWQTLRFADVNGDGKVDICMRNDSGIQCYLSTGNGWEYSAGYDSFATGQFIFSNSTDQHGYGTFDNDNWGTLQFVDINGDGKADVCMRNDSGLQCYLSTGSGWVYSAGYDSFATGQLIFSNSTNQHGYGTFDNDNWQTLRFADVNGDGKVDVCMRNDSGLQCYLSTGNGWVYSAGYDSFATGQFIFSNSTDQHGYGTFDTDNWGTLQFVDVNGDGKADVCMRSDSGLQCYLSTGSGWVYSENYDTYSTGRMLFKNTPNFDEDNWTTLQFADINGDGRNEPCIRMDTGMNCGVLGAEYKPQVDLLTSISTGRGDLITINYAPSTHYTTTLPFAMQVVSSIVSNDGNGSVSTSNYSYSNGFFNVGEQDFRGFNYVKVTGPVELNEKQTITETWFHQGNDTDVIPESATQEDLKARANAPTGYMKGRPYRTRVSDAQMKYSETTTIYSQDTDGVAPYFTPPLEVNSYVYSSDSSYKQTKAAYAYDDYGNIIREEQYGDVSDSTDDRTVFRTFSNNTNNWLVGLPTSETLYPGIFKDIQDVGTITPASSTSYYYDGNITDCASTSDNQYPDKGRLIRTKRWLHYDGDTDSTIEERRAYDNYGNPVCHRDPKGNITTIGYDPSNTFPLTVTNPLGQQIVTQYYGVNGVVADNGFYGQVKNVTDPNGAVASKEYDVFGRPSKMTRADGVWTSWDYKIDGVIGSQRVRTVTSDGIWTENYFDGFGRTYLSKALGPESKIIATNTVYDSRGAKYKSSIPYLFGVEEPHYVQTDYDAIGRTIRTEQESTADKPIRSLACYTKDATVKIDPNNHRRREVYDIAGHLIKVQEYTGTFSSCTTEEGTPYATTSYQYDLLGNLRFVTDTKANQTEMRYDSLGRKRYMNDPDMGVWNYSFDANGNLETQTDAKGQVITFVYDGLNRLKTKTNGTSLVLTNYYDETTSSNSKGRLSRMVDPTGQAVYNYDKTGNVTSSTKTIDATSYTFGFTYPNGRLGSITYPDNETVNYYYDAGYLKSVTGYLINSNFDAQGRPWNTAFSSGGASSSYSYDPVTKRLSTLSVVSPQQGLLIDNVYGYDNKGNVTSITDNLNKTRPTNLSSESYTTIHAHAIGSTGSGRIFAYDNNGNIKDDGQRTITYNYDNMPATVNNVSFAYDGTVTRVKKISPWGTIIYVNKLYECISGGACSKYIFAGGNRIALKSGNSTYFYHPDHQGSTSVVTDPAGNKKEDIAYYPFGEIRQENGTTPVSHTYTSQELDGETGLYNYNARLYDPDLGRFMTPDSIVQNPADPQTLNRYSYTSNNPINRTDPSGHSWFSKLLHNNIVGPIIGTLGDMILPGASIYVNSQSTSGRYILAGETIAATAALSGGVSSLAGGGIGGAFLGGGVAGAATSALSGGDVLQGAVLGALGGAIIGTASSFASANFSPFGNGPFASIGNRLFNSGLTGAVFGASYAAATGGNIGQGAMRGAAIWAGGEAANMAIGHAYGFIASGGNGPTFSNGAFVYNANTPGWTTIGNVITGPSGLGNELTRDRIPVPGMTFLDHEMGHMPQSTVLGPAYLPAHAASLTVGASIGLVNGQSAEYGSHAYGLLERYYHPVPQW